MSVPQIIKRKSWRRLSALLLPLALLGVLPASSQATAGMWSWQNPQPQGNTLMGVCFVDTATGWAVGGYGTILAYEEYCGAPTVTGFPVS